MQLKASGILFLLLAALAAGAGCATGGSVSQSRENPGSVAEKAIRQAEEHTAAGHYTAALMLYAELYDTCKDRKVIERYIGAGKQAREAADRALQKKDFANAGSLYTALLESKVTAAAQPGLLSFNDDYLRKQIRVCSQSLMETGIIKYRDEKLDDAIAAWEKVLVFEPGNRAVVKALETANRQRNTLKKIP